jgi:thioredoxin-dependent peroxiredoxin
MVSYRQTSFDIGHRLMSPPRSSPRPPRWESSLMRLSPGTTVPEFVVDTLDGSRFDLAALRGQPVWLAFFRFATCPLCNLRIHQMKAVWPRYAGRVGFLGVFQSPKSRFEGTTLKEVPFTIAADPELHLYQRFGLEKSVLGLVHPKVAVAGMEALRAGIPMQATGPKDGGALRVPGDFLIDRHGTLQVARYGAHISDHIPFDDVDAFLARHG